MTKEILSVHLQDFPKLKGSYDTDLVRKMDKVREICSVALFIRDKKNLRVRLPLDSIKIYGKNVSELKDLSSIIADEINVKNVDFLENVDEVAELKLELDFKKLGVKFGKKVPEILKAAKENNWKKLDNNKVEVAGEILNSDEFEIKLMVKNNDGSFGVLSTNDIVVQLDLNVTKELEYEGLARDIVRFIQNSRKEANFNISDKIETYLLTSSDKIKEAINANFDYITEQTLTIKFDFVDTIQGKVFNGKIDDIDVSIALKVANS